jgi:hypothetical protein
MTDNNEQPATLPVAPPLKITTAQHAAQAKRQLRTWGPPALAIGLAQVFGLAHIQGDFTPAAANFIAQNGVAVATLAFVAWASTNVCRWAAPKINDHMETAARVAESTEALAAAATESARHQGELLLEIARTKSTLDETDAVARSQRAGTLSAVEDGRSENTTAHTTMLSAVAALQGDITRANASLDAIRLVLAEEGKPLEIECRVRPMPPAYIDPHP